MLQVDDSRTEPKNTGLAPMFFRGARKGSPKPHPVPGSAVPSTSRERVIEGLSRSAAPGERKKASARAYFR